MREMVCQSGGYRMKDVSVQRNYKDTLFRMLFKEKERLLSLYNGLNGLYGCGEAGDYNTGERNLYEL